MTRLKFMSMDEQVETIEQSAQEALMVREEIRETKIIEAQRCWVCVIFFAYVCVGTSDSTTASDESTVFLF
jgi:hypothetical protein